MSQMSAASCVCKERSTFPDGFFPWILWSKLIQRFHVVFVKQSSSRTHASTHWHTHTVLATYTSSFLKRRPVHWTYILPFWKNRAALGPEYLLNITCKIDLYCDSGDTKSFLLIHRAQQNAAIQISTWFLGLLEKLLSQGLHVHWSSGVGVGGFGDLS
jgi:hypothetical protein